MARFEISGLAAPIGEEAYVPGRYGFFREPGVRMERFADGFRLANTSCPLVVEHDDKRKVGTASLRRTSRGVEFTCQVDDSTPLGASVVTAVKYGSLRGVSVNMKVLREDQTYGEFACRIVEQARFNEISLTSKPTYRSAHARVRELPAYTSTTSLSASRGADKTRAGVTRRSAARGAVRPSQTVSAARQEFYRCATSGHRVSACTCCESWPANPRPKRMARVR